MPRVSGLGPTAPAYRAVAPKPSASLASSPVDTFEIAPPKLHPHAPAGAAEVVVASYNVENLFDTAPDETVKDGTQFTPDGDYRWSEAKLAKKLAQLGQSIRAINGGKGPDILALNEVENAAIVERLRDDALGGLGYDTICHLDTEDKRGIDNAILSKWPMIGAPALHTVHGGPLWKDQKTRGILEATFDVKGVPLTVFVNHWPAGLGWEERRLQREDAGKQLRAIIEAKLAIDPGAEIMVMGDFNANPAETAKGLGASGDPAQVKSGARPLYGTLACLADQIRKSKGLPEARSLEAVDALLPKDGPSIGTHWDSWSKKWNALDQIFVSRGLLDDEGLAWVEGSTQIGRSAAISDAQGRPKSTFPSEKYAEHTVEGIGVSDHFPLVARLVRKTKPA